jgi:hypothetical protein
METHGGKVSASNGDKNTYRPSRAQVHMREVRVALYLHVRLVPEALAIPEYPLHSFQLDLVQMERERVGGIAGGLLPMG